MKTAKKTFKQLRRKTMKIAILMPALAILFAIALFVGAANFVNASHHNSMMFSADISDMDTNNDGVVSFKEYSDFHSEQLRWSFNALDADNDGSISAGEWDTFLKMHGVGMKNEYKHQG
jgi:hypothetical protein